MRKRWFLWMMALLASQCLLADLAVQNIQVQQRWPWNGLVDIDYDIVCDDPDAPVFVFFNGKDKDLNRQIPMLTLTGDAANGQSVKAGHHRTTWNMTKDSPGLHSTAFSVHIELAQGSGLYMVIDLSGGANASSYPVAYSVVGPDLTDDTCRGTKLWLRFIPPGTNVATGYKQQKGFYMGVFEVTQKQYTLVMGSNPSVTTYNNGNYYPVNQVSYNMIRGSSEGSAYPSHNRVDASSFMGKLRAKTGLNCDLPTEVQWEYACRAGTNNNTSNADGKTQYQVAHYWNDGRGNNIMKVGSLTPNAWGLYDCLGSMWEWCRDWYTSGSSRALRGGSWNYEASIATCASRHYNGPGNWYRDHGFRLAVLPSE